MKEIKDIDKEIDKGSTGGFKDPHGDIYYLLNGEYHREDGPACIWSNGHKWWYLYGMRHRSNGPAVEYPDGNKSWYLHGERAESEKQFYDPQWRKKIEIKIFL